jgi:glycosyltransferase involved in cell wall biosynthesis
VADQNNRPKVSIVVPTYNRIDFLKECLQSIDDQTFRDFELIVVDDASSDETEAFLHSRPLTQYIRLQQNQGVSKARNVGVRLARGQYICFLDSDDLWLKDKLKIQAQWMDAHSECMAIHTDEIWIRKGKRVNPMNRHAKKGGDIFDHCLPLCVVSPSSVMLRATLLEEVGLFDESLPACEDYDLWLRIAARYPFHFMSDKLTVKRGGHDDQLSRKYWGMDRFRVHSLVNLLESGILDSRQKMVTAQMLLEKCRILILGFAKRDKTDAVSEYRKIMEKYSILAGLEGEC